MADASLDTWTVAERQWRAAASLLDCEIRRIGAVEGVDDAALAHQAHDGDPGPAASPG